MSDQLETQARGDVSTVDADTERSDCHWCKTTGKRSKRMPKNTAGKRLLAIVDCQACGGAGFIPRTKRRDLESGDWKRKRIERSYPSFQAPGPAPFACTTATAGIERKLLLDEEELCFLAGQWKVFQKLDKHRYSTDDLVTSHIACRWASSLGYTSPTMLDIGCGLGSVLLCNAWQIPQAICVGLETQQNRFELARRNISYNVGNFPSDQQRVAVFHWDLRSPLSDFPDLPTQAHARLVARVGLPPKFDIVTGTPPYFPPGTGIAPSTGESNGCLYECKGGVEEYCKAAGGYLRPPVTADKEVLPSVFVLCNTALTSLRVYVACQKNNLVIVERTDVVPRTGKPTLFCVFVIVTQSWLKASPGKLGPLPAPSISAELFNPAIDIDILDPSYRVPTGASLRGEIIHVLTVRETAAPTASVPSYAATATATGMGGDVAVGQTAQQQHLHHSAEYAKLLHDLGKPNSFDRETFNVDLCVTGLDSQSTDKF
jgi:tRNA1Val (adenine37-N6)-methyltransferase